MTRMTWSSITPRPPFNGLCWPISRRVWLFGSPIVTPSLKPAAFTSRSTIAFLCSLVLLLAITGQWAGAASERDEDMAFVPAGEFIMGTAEGSDGLPDEQPERR